MKGRQILKVVPFGGYPREVLVAVGVPPARIIAKLERMGVELTQGDRTLFEQNDWRDGLSMCLDSKQLVLQIREPIVTDEDVALLMHEIFHTVSWNMKLAGIRLTDDSSEEAYAYAIQDLTAKVVRLLR